MDRAERHAKSTHHHRKNAMPPATTPTEGAQRGIGAETTDPPTTCPVREGNHGLRGVPASSSANSILRIRGDAPNGSARPPRAGIDLARSTACADTTRRVVVTDLPDFGVSGSFGMGHPRSITTRLRWRATSSGRNGLAGLGELIEYQQRIGGDERGALSYSLENSLASRK